MKKLYKNGKVIDAEDEQLSIMKNAGWLDKDPALTPEVVVPAKEEISDVEEPVVPEAEEPVVPKKPAVRKPAPKRIKKINKE